MVAAGARGTAGDHLLQLDQGGAPAPVPGPLPAPGDHPYPGLHLRGQDRQPGRLAHLQEEVKKLIFVRFSQNGDRKCVGTWRLRRGGKEDGVWRLRRIVEGTFSHRPTGKTGGQHLK